MRQHQDGKCNPKIYTAIQVYCIIFGAAIQSRTFVLAVIFVFKIKKRR